MSAPVLGQRKGETKRRYGNNNAEERAKWKKRIEGKKRCGRKYGEAEREVDFDLFP